MAILQTQRLVRLLGRWSLLPWLAAMHGAKRCALFVALSVVLGSPSALRAQPPGTTPFQTRFQSALELYRNDEFVRAFEAFYQLALEQPNSAVLGTLGAVATNQIEDAAFVRRWTQRADANPGDPIANYVAGIVMHYTAHSLKDTRAEKQPYYRRCLHYLRRTLPAFEGVHRVWIYLAVSHHRLGEVAPAREAIARAVALGLDDPDVLYCRAELMHRENPQQAISDLERYLQLMRINAARGAVVNPSKEGRVADMLAYVRAVAAGEVPDSDLWDSLDDGVWRDPRVLRWWARRRAPQVAVVAVALGAAAYALRRWRRARRGHP